MQPPVGWYPGISGQRSIRKDALQAWPPVGWYPGISGFVDKKPKER